MKDAQGNSQDVVHHGGVLEGQNAMVMRRADGLSFVLFVNYRLGSALSATDHGAELNAIANAVTSWPTKDLFPEMRIPPFQRPCPQLDRIQDKSENVSMDGIEVKGTALGNVETVYFDGQPITSTSAEDLVRGYFTYDDLNRLIVHPPQGLRPGFYQLVVKDSRCLSNGTSVELTCTKDPTLVCPPTLVAGGKLELVGSKGSLSNQTILQLLFSSIEKPSILPGIGSLDIGDGFKELFLWGPGRTVSTTTCSTQWAAPTLPALKGVTVHFQALLQDPAKKKPFPLSATNVSSVQLR